MKRINTAGHVGGQAPTFAIAYSADTDTTCLRADFYMHCIQPALDDRPIRLFNPLNLGNAVSAVFLMCLDVPVCVAWALTLLGLLQLAQCASDPKWHHRSDTASIPHAAAVLCLFLCGTDCSGSLKPEGVGPRKGFSAFLSWYFGSTEQVQPYHSVPKFRTHWKF